MGIELMAMGAIQDAKLKGGGHAWGRDKGSTGAQKVGCIFKKSPLILDNRSWLSLVKSWILILVRFFAIDLFSEGYSRFRYPCQANLRLLK